MDKTKVGQTQYTHAMAFSIRLSDQGIDRLDELVRMGDFRDRAETVRTALNLLYTVLRDQGEGLEFVSMPAEELRKRPVARSVRRPEIR